MSATHQNQLNGFPCRCADCESARRNVSTDMRDWICKGPIYMTPVHKKAAISRPLSSLVSRSSGSSLGVSAERPACSWLLVGRPERCRLWRQADVSQSRPCRDRIPTEPAFWASHVLHEIVVMGLNLESVNPPHATKVIVTTDYTEALRWVRREIVIK